jgi:hypothetical protein
MQDYFDYINGKDASIEAEDREIASIRNKKFNYEQNYYNYNN